MQGHTPEVPADYVAGSFVRGYHKQKTGEIPLDEIDTGRLNPMPLWAQQTLREHAAAPPMRRLMLPGRRQNLSENPLPIGPDGRPFLIARSEMSTLDIIKVVVKEFFLLMHAYPETIELDGARWEKVGVFIQFFYPRPDLAIPLKRAESNSYDVVVRGKPQRKAN